MVRQAADEAHEAGGAMITGVMVDCSHGNAGGQYKNQMKVVDDIFIMCAEDDPIDVDASSSDVRRHVSDNIVGVMIESNIVEGSQKLSQSSGVQLTPIDGSASSGVDVHAAQQSSSLSSLTYGQSITDGCISWDDTVIALDALAKAVTHRRARAAKRGGGTK